MAQPLVENPMVLERPIPYEPPVRIVKPDPICKCGCNRPISTIQYRTFEGEPLFEESCYLRISYQEKWLIKEVG